MTTNADHSIDTVLTGLRNTHAPTNLEARIHARLAQAEASSASHSSFIDIILSSRLAHWQAPRLLRPSPMGIAAAAAACAAIILIVTFPHHQQRHTPVTANISAHAPSVVQTFHTAPTAHASEIFRPGSHSTPVDQTSISASITNPTDPEAIALAETLALSHPAPPLPLTAQEALLLRSTRHGQPIEIAELDSARAALPRPISAPHERTAIDTYIHAMLQPLAAAEAIAPTPSDEPTSSNPTDPPSSK